MAKFFFGAAVGGRLRLRDIPDWGYWKSRNIAYWDETHIEGMPRLASLGQKVWSADELDEAIVASLDLPGVQALWIHDSLLGEARRRWKESRRTVRNRLEERAPAAAALVIAAACVVGLVAMAHGPNQVAQVAPPPLARGHEAVQTLTPPLARGHETAQAHTPPLVRRNESTEAFTPPAVPSESPSRRVVARERPAAAAVARPIPLRAHRARAHQPVHRAIRAAFAVSVGTFVSPESAAQVKHLVQSKGYIVRIVPVGTLSQVVTPPCANRLQAERVARGLLATGVPAQLTSWRGL